MHKFGARGGIRLRAAGTAARLVQARRFHIQSRRVNADK